MVGSGNSGSPLLWQKGAVTVLETLGGTGSTAVGINPAGQVVGYSGPVAGEIHPLLWTSK